MLFSHFLKIEVQIKGKGCVRMEIHEQKPKTYLVSHSSTRSLLMAGTGLEGALWYADITSSSSVFEDDRLNEKVKIENTINFTCFQKKQRKNIPCERQFVDLHFVIVICFVVLWLFRWFIWRQHRLKKARILKKKTKKKQTLQKMTTKMPECKNRYSAPKSPANLNVIFLRGHSYLVAMEFATRSK